MICFHCNDTGVRTGRPEVPWGPDDGRLCNCARGVWIREYLAGLAATALGRPVRTGRLSSSEPNVQNVEKFTRRRLPCVFCDTEIDGPIVGAGDGTGRRFAHQVCWKLAELIREVTREAGSDSLSFSGAAVLLGRLKAVLPKAFR